MTFSEFAVNAVFYLFALTAVFGAVMCAASQNIVRTAFSLVLVLGSVAALYGLAKMDFIMAVQILVYVGGILVLIIFAVMLTHRITDVKISNASAPGPVAFFAVASLFFAIVLVVLNHAWVVNPATDAPLTKAIGRELMGAYLLPFEMISVLLLAALVGAAFLARKEVKDK